MKVSLQMDVFGLDDETRELGKEIPRENIQAPPTQSRRCEFELPVVKVQLRRKWQTNKPPDQECFCAPKAGIRKSPNDGFSQ